MNLIKKMLLLLRTAWRYLTDNCKIYQIIYQSIQVPIKFVRRKNVFVLFFLCFLLIDLVKILKYDVSR